MTAGVIGLATTVVDGWPTKASNASGPGETANAFDVCVIEPDVTVTARPVSAVTAVTDAVPDVAAGAQPKAP